MQTRTDVSHCLRHAREEVLMALGAPTAREEGRHRRQADKYMTKAMRGIQQEPNQAYDWSSF
jgi:hypothetical protein